MIREYTKKDRNLIISLLQQEIIIDTEEIAFVLDNSEHIIVHVDEKQVITGFGYYRRWGGNQKADVYVFVGKNYRRQTIGTQLYQILEKDIEIYEPHLISTRVQLLNESESTFYKNRGFRPWYTDYLLECDVTEKSVNNYTDELKIITYEDCYFEQYANGIRNSFYELRKENRFEPYLCCELNDEKRKELVDSKDNIFLLMDHEALIGSVIVYQSGQIADVFIVAEYRGHGYAKRLLQFAYEKTREYGNVKMQLDAISWNVKALSLYRSVGFQIIQTTQYYVSEEIINE